MQEIFKREKARLEKMLVVSYIYSHQLGFLRDTVIAKTQPIA